MSIATLTATIAESLRCQWRKILDAGAGMALVACEPMVQDVARNIAQAVTTANDNEAERERMEAGHA